MAWKQVKDFNINKMGTTPGYCLQNVRLGFDIPPLYPDAKTAMEANKNAGTLHPMSEIPTNVAVPVFCDTASVYEHVIVDDHGTYYSDGKKVTNPQAFVYFGWGETLNGVRVVEWVPDPVPQKSNEEIADEVIAGKWGVAPERYERLRAAGYDPVVIQSIVNEKMAGTGIKVGDKVVPTKWVSYDGKALKKTRDFYYVYQLSGNRAVLTADRMGGPVYAAVDKNNLRKV